MACLTSCQAGSDPDKAIADAPSSGSDAEYAIRWLVRPVSASDQDTATSVAVGPTLQETINALGASEKGKSKGVTYYAAKPGADPIPGMDVILRKRSTDKKTEFTYKIRSESVPAVDPLLPACDGNGPTTPEFDITLSGPTQTIRRWSMSCTFEVEDGAMPPSWMDGATERPCPITMTRYEARSPSNPAAGKVRPVKVEEWRFGAYATLVEVSWKASDAAADEASFRAAVSPILNLASSTRLDLLAKPAPSKERLARDCDALIPPQ